MNDKEVWRPIAREEHTQLGSVKTFSTFFIGYGDLLWAPHMDKLHGAYCECGGGDESHEDSKHEGPGGRGSGEANPLSDRETPLVVPAAVNGFMARSWCKLFVDGFG